MHWCGPPRRLFPPAVEGKTACCDFTHLGPKVRPALKDPAHREQHGDVQTEVPQALFDGLPLNSAHTFMVPRWCTLLTLVNTSLFLYRHHEFKMFIYPALGEETPTSFLIFRECDHASKLNYDGGDGENSLVCNQLCHVSLLACWHQYLAQEVAAPPVSAV